MPHTAFDRGGEGDAAPPAAARRVGCRLGAGRDAGRAAAALGPGGRVAPAGRDRQSPRRDRRGTARQPEHHRAPGAEGDRVAVSRGHGTKRVRPARRPPPHRHRPAAARAGRPVHPRHLRHLLLRPVRDAPALRGSRARLDRVLARRRVQVAGRGLGPLVAGANARGADGSAPVGRALRARLVPRGVRLVRSGVPVRLGQVPPRRGARGAARRPGAPLLRWRPARRAGVRARAGDHVHAAVPGQGADEAPVAGDRVEAGRAPAAQGGRVERPESKRG